MEPTKRRGFIVPTFASPFRLYEKLPKAEFLSGQREVARAATTWTSQLGRKTGEDTRTGAWLGVGMDVASTHKAAEPDDALVLGAACIACLAADGAPLAARFGLVAGLCVAAAAHENLGRVASRASAVAARDVGPVAAAAASNARRASFAALAALQVISLLPVMFEYVSAGHAVHSALPEMFL